MPVWVRGEEEAWLTSPFLPQKLAITALGTSASTGAKGLEGDIAYFESFDALVAAPDTQVKGKKIGRAHVRTPVTNAHLVCRLLLEKKNTTITSEKNNIKQK